MCILFEITHQSVLFTDLNLSNVIFLVNVELRFALRASTARTLSLPGRIVLNVLCMSKRAGRIVLNELCMSKRVVMKSIPSSLRFKREKKL